MDAQIIKITEAGKDALQEFENARDNVTKKMAEDNRSRIREVLLVILGAALTTLFALLVKYFDVIITFIRSLF